MLQDRRLSDLEISAAQKLFKMSNGEDLYLSRPELVALQSLGFAIADIDAFEPDEPLDTEYLN